MPVEKTCTLDGHDPITLREVREEINYWTKAPVRHPEWFESTAFREKVATRLARLKSLEEKYGEEWKGSPLDAIAVWVHGHKFLAGLILAMLVLLVLGASFSGASDLWQRIDAAIGHAPSLDVP